jgi:hypothetical protein
MGFRAKNARDAKTEAFEGNPTKINITTRVKGSFCITSSLGGFPSFARHSNAVFRVIPYGAPGVSFAFWEAANRGRPVPNRVWERVAIEVLKD